MAQVRVVPFNIQTGDIYPAQNIDPFFAAYCMRGTAFFPVLENPVTKRMEGTLYGADTKDKFKFVVGKDKCLWSKTLLKQSNAKIQSLMAGQSPTQAKAYLEYKALAAEIRYVYPMPCTKEDMFGPVRTVFGTIFSSDAFITPEERQRDLDGTGPYMRFTDVLNAALGYCVTTQTYPYDPRQANNLIASLTNSLLCMPTTRTDVTANCSGLVFMTGLHGLLCVLEQLHAAFGDEHTPLVPPNDMTALLYILAEFLRKKSSHKSAVLQAVLSIVLGRRVPVQIIPLGGRGVVPRGLYANWGEVSESTLTSALTMLDWIKTTFPSSGSFVASVGDHGRTIVGNGTKGDGVGSFATMSKEFVAQISGGGGAAGAGASAGSGSSVQIQGSKRPRAGADMPVGAEEACFDGGTGWDRMRADVDLTS